MAYQSIGLGSSANDGTGDTLRAGGDKVNDNFNEIYKFLNRQKISKKVMNINQTTFILNKLFNSKKNTKKYKR